MQTDDASPKSVDALIVRAPDILRGRPRIRDHRITVHRIARWWQIGLSIDEILAEHSTLQPAEVHAALAFYHLNRAEIDGYLEEERAVLDAAERSCSAA